MKDYQLQHLQEYVPRFYFNGVGNAPLLIQQTGVATVSETPTPTDIATIQDHTTV